MSFLLAGLVVNVVGFAVVPAAGDAAEVPRGRPARIAPVPGKPMPAASVPRPAVAGTRSDPAVTQAGGMHGGHCGHCRRHACPQCRIPDADPGLAHGPCHHGLCPAHCPVRPDVFGFYGTQWRKWPGSGVMQASNRDEATPARPPKAEVPEAAEESLQPPDGNEPLPAPAAAGAGRAAATDGPEDEQPADGGKADAAPARPPLPQPFPDVDDGASGPRRSGRRTPRIIFLDEQDDDHPGSRFAARLVNITDDDTRVAPPAGSVSRGIARAGGGPPNAALEPEIAAGAAATGPRPDTSWRRFLAAGDGDQTGPAGP